MKNLRGAGHLAEPVRQLATGVAVLKLERQPYLLAYQFLSQDGFKMHQKPFSAWESLQRSRRPLVGWKGDIPPLDAFGASTHGAYDASVPAYNF